MTARDCRSQPDWRWHQLSSPNPATSMFPREIKNWANGNNSTRINLLMRHVIMALDVIEIHCLGNAIMLV